MGLNIKNSQVEKLAEEVANLTGETKTEAIRKSLAEGKSRLQLRTFHVDRKTRIRAVLEREIWPELPKKETGKTLSRKKREAILGYGDEGV